MKPENDFSKKEVKTLEKVKVTGPTDSVSKTNPNRWTLKLKAKKKKQM